MSHIEIYKNKGLTGLVNLGNTCYINSSLQIISNIPELNEYINEFVKSKELKNIAFTSIAYSKFAGMNIISFDEMMSNPKRIISLLADKLNITLTKNEIDKIAKKVSKEEIIHKVKKLHKGDDSAEKFDKSSGLHNNHINDAKSGKWKYILSNEEANIITSECNDYLELFGYPNENV